MTDGLTVPSIWPSTRWEITTRADDAVRALRSRHYSTFGSTGKTVGPPGRVIVLRTADGRAGWISHYPAPELALDGIDAWRCSLFRNEGDRLSSALIAEARAITFDAWATTTTAVEWLTWIDRTKIRSSNPGYCFKLDGWALDRDWQHRRLVRLRRVIIGP